MATATGSGSPSALAVGPGRLSQVPVRPALEPRGSRRSPSDPLFARVLAGQAEGERFELSRDVTAQNGFRDRLAGA